MDRFSLQNREAVPTPTVWARNLAAASAVNLFLGDCAGFGAARHANKNDVGSVQYFWPIFCVKGDETDPLRIVEDPGSMKLERLLPHFRHRC